MLTKNKNPPKRTPFEMLDRTAGLEYTSIPFGCTLVDTLKWPIKANMIDTVNNAYCLIFMKSHPLQEIFNKMLRLS